MKQFVDRLAHADRGLLAVSGILLLAGLVMVASASITLADRQYAEPFYYLARQGSAAVAGLLFAAVLLMVPMRAWLAVSPWLAFVAFVLLLSVLVPGLGRTVNGSTRWLAVGGINLIQVSEPARLLLLLYLCGYVVRHGETLRSSLLGYAKPMAIVTLACGLLLLQPDFGAAALLAGISLAVLFAGGARLREVVLSVLAFGAALGALAVLSPYRLARLTGFMDPWADPYDSGFQLTQSLIAIGTGEWLGLGLGSSVQKLFYLPEAHTDFVFAVIAEEFGLLGSVVIILLFGALVWRALLVADAAARRDAVFETALAFGIAVWLGTQAAINLGVNMGILPTKGLTLPLVSYGRSSLLVVLAALGLLLRIDLENRRPPGTQRRRGPGRQGGGR